MFLGSRLQGSRLRLRVQGSQVAGSYYSPNVGVCGNHAVQMDHNIENNMEARVSF